VKRTAHCGFAVFAVFGRKLSASDLSFFRRNPRPPTIRRIKNTATGSLFFRCFSLFLRENAGS
jgi:hypothetical protein